MGSCPFNASSTQSPLSAGYEQFLDWFSEIGYLRFQKFNQSPFYFYSVHHVLIGICAVGVGSVTMKCCACTSFCGWFLLEGAAAEHWSKKCAGAGAGSGEPYERRQQGQRSG